MREGNSIDGPARRALHITYDKGPRIKASLGVGGDPQDGLDQVTFIVGELVVWQAHQPGCPHAFGQSAASASAIHTSSAAATSVALARNCGAYCFEK